MTPFLFANSEFCPAIQQALADQQFTTATPVQEATIADILAGHDVLASAQTGTGKTLAFALPIIEQIIRQPKEQTPKQLRALILTPTRELAAQVAKDIGEMTVHSKVSIFMAYGGVSINPQKKALHLGLDILVATPGRLLDLVRNQAVDLSSLEFLVFDEADRMLDLGFKDEIDLLLKRINKQRQTLLFSATLNDRIFALSKTMLNAPKVIETSQRNTAATTVEQLFYTMDANKKAPALSYLIGSKNWRQVLVFTRKKETADKLVKELILDGLKAAAIHGDKTQGAREKALEQFKSGEVRVLVATDVAARGLHIEQLPVVINHQLPFHAEDYVHRIGRTGRAGEAGLAISMVANDEQTMFEQIKTLLDLPLLGQQWMPGFEPNLKQLDAAAKPKSKKALRDAALKQGKLKRGR